MGREGPAEKEILLLLHRKRKPVTWAQGVVYVINHLFTVVAVNGTVQGAVTG